MASFGSMPTQCGSLRRGAEQLLRQAHRRGAAHPPRRDGSIWAQGSVLPERLLSDDASVADGTTMLTTTEATRHNWGHLARVPGCASSRGMLDTAPQWIEHRGGGIEWIVNHGDGVAKSRDDVSGPATDIGGDIGSGDPAPRGLVRQRSRRRRSRRRAVLLRPTRRDPR